MATLLSVIMLVALSSCAMGKKELCAENINYIKNLDAEITISVCASKKNFVSDMVDFAKKHQDVVMSSETEYEYFSLTQKMLSEYAKHNKKITLEYAEPNNFEFTAKVANQKEYSLFYGDIIVSYTSNQKEYVKILSFDDVYITEKSSNSENYKKHIIVGNQLETALTGAISYVTNVENKKIALFSGHSNKTYTKPYYNLLLENNYNVTEISNTQITKISDEYSAIVICAPIVDFTTDEIAVISNFLNNDGKLGKGLMFFPDVTCPQLPNLYDFLKQWGIQIDEGMLYGTGGNANISNVNTALFIDPIAIKDDNITKNILSSYAITNYNIPMHSCTPKTPQIKASVLMKTANTAIAAPISFKDWADYTEYTPKQYDCVIQSVESNYDQNNNLDVSCVFAFSSVEFTNSQWEEQYQICNTDIAVLCTDRATQIENLSITFKPKTI